MHNGFVVRVEMVLIKEDRETIIEKQSTVIKSLSKHSMKDRKSNAQKMASSHVHVEENSYMDDR